MKLHLPKQLFTALLAALTLAAPAARGELYVETAADFYGGNHAFVFTLDSALLTNGDADLLAAYWGTEMSNTYGANAYQVSYDGSTYTFAAGRGNLSSGTLDDDANIGTYQDKLTSGALEAGHRYLVQVKGENQKQTITLVDLDNRSSISMSGTSYAGNMNKYSATMNTAVSSQSGYGVSAVYVWNATSGDSADFAVSNFWGTPDDITGKNVFFAANNSSTNNSSTAYVSTVNVTSAVSVANMDVYGSYTFGGTGTLTVTGGLNIAAGASAIINAATTLSGTVTNNNSLTITGDLNGSATFVLNGGSNLLLNNGRVIAFNNKKAGEGFQASGTGTITIGDGTVVNLTNDGQIKQGAIAGNVVVLGGGELRLSGGKSLFGYDDGGTKSVTLRGTEGKTALMDITHATVENTQHLSTDLILEGYATIQSSGSPLETYYYQSSGRGNITATGTNNLISANITLNRALTVTVTKATDTLEISGQISSTGSAKITKTGAGELVLSGANTYGVGTNISGGTVTTKNAAALGTGDVTMTGGILNVTNVADRDTDLTVGGAIVMNADATAKLATTGTTLSLGTTGSVKKTNAGGTQHVIIASNGTNAASLTARSDNAQLTQLQADASFTIQDMTLTNTTITAADVDTKVNLQNVEDSTALLAKGAFTLHATPTVGEASSGESHRTLSYSNGLAIATDGNASLTLNLDVVNAVAGDAHGTYDLTITLSGFDANFAVTEDILDMVGFDSTSWLGQALVSPKAEYSEVTEQPPATAGESGVPTVSYSAVTVDNVGSLVITIAGLNVPEPATSTLSLMALAALAARRRRK